MVVKHLKLIWNYFILNIKKEYQYKSSFFMQIIMMIFNDLFIIIQWIVIFNIVDDIGGYGFKECMLLYALAAGGYGVAHVFFGGAWNIKDIVYEGRMDVFLTQPKNALINICASQTDISAIGDILYSIIVLAIIGAPWWWYLVLIPGIIIAGLLYVSTYVAFVSLCFWVKRGDAAADCLEGTLNKAANYPPAIFTGVAKWLLFTIVPAFFLTFIPAQYLFLTPNIWWILGLLGVTVLWVILAFTIFHLGLKKYNSGSLMSGRL